jgi:hypothetical protein
MKTSFSFKSLIPDLLALTIFLFFVFIYFSPLLQGKVLSMHDIDMASGAAQELKDFHEKTGRWAWWTNSMFGGMPGYMIAGGYDYNLVAKIGSFLNKLLPVPANLFFLLMTGFYVLARILRLPFWGAVACSVAYAFGTYNLLYTEAGHISKVLALAFIPGLLGGFVLIFRKNYLFGAFVTALFMGLELYANHLQITYYFFFVLLAFGVYKVVECVRSGEYGHIIKSAATILIAIIIGVGMHTQRLWSNYVYSKETIRGKSELTQTESGKTGLDKDYAFAWSYGISETFNLIIPDLMGGGSVGALDQKSSTYKVLTANGVPAAGADQFIQNLPLYHGPQSFTSGPAYVGIVVFFFFVLGLFILKSRWKWVHLGVVIFLILLSWGNHLPSLNYLLFDHFPGYNKFRAVSMILTVVHFMLVWGAAYTINELMITNSKDFKLLKRPVLYTFIVISGLFLIGYLSVNFVGIRDAGLADSLKGSLGENITNQVIAALRDDRASMALGDIIRGLVFTLFAAALVFLFSTQKINVKIAGILLVVLFAADLIPVGKRYFNNDDFEPKYRSTAGRFEPNAADIEILKDQSPDYRVLNLATSSGFMSDARDSYFHKSLGGYHGAKLKKYNELVTEQMIKDGRLNIGIINMLNTKYFIVNGPSGEQAQLNPEALGNAWFVDSLISVPGADEELVLTGEINTSNTAVTQNSFVSENRMYPNDSSSVIRLVSYEPDRLVYNSDNKDTQFAVFSEIYYRGNDDWKSYIDGKETPHIKVNYVLRGMEIPSGKHEIVFEFKPKSVYAGRNYDLVFSVGFLALGLAGFYYSFRKKSKTN